MSVEASISINQLDLAQGSLTTTSVQTRLNYTFSPRILFSGLLQYNSAGDSLSNNLHFRWEYNPGSELFVVYIEDRVTDPLTPNRFSALRNRGLAIKMTRLLRL